LIPSDDQILEQVRSALSEDIGPGDVSAALIPADRTSTAVLISRDGGLVAGRAWCEHAFRSCSPDIDAEWYVMDGDRVSNNQTLARFHGPARALLSAERTALNFLQLLSGVATRTREYVDAVTGTGVRILDTRKTVPGLRLAQKYAVRVGGGHNHRIGLFDLIMLKENHIAAAGGIRGAVEHARERFPTLGIEVEVENVDEFSEALAAGANRILLDNFEPDALREAVERNTGKAVLEASGGITLDTIRIVAETGVDEISVGELTKRIEPLDLSLRIDG
jgi:nicotinate-nucleotide pyrophosphorylase (carboxylating)